MNADVNIPSTDEGCGDDRGVVQSVLKSTTKRRSDVTVESIESMVKGVRISDDSSWKRRMKAQLTSLLMKTRSRVRHARMINLRPHKSIQKC